MEHLSEHRVISCTGETVKVQRADESASGAKCIPLDHFAFQFTEAQMRVLANSNARVAINVVTGKWEQLVA